MLVLLLKGLGKRGRLKLAVGLILVIGLVVTGVVLKAQRDQAAAYAQKQSSCSQPLSAPACKEGQVPSVDHCICQLPKKCNFKCQCVTPCTPTANHPCPH